MIDNKLESLRAEFEGVKSKRAYLPYADALRRNNLLKQALEICKQGLKIDPASVSGHTLLARIYFDMGQIDYCIDVLKFVIEREPMALQSLMLLTRAFIKKKDFDSAEKHCAKLQEFLPNDNRVNMLARDIRQFKRRLSEKAKAEKIEVREIKSVAGFQSKINQVKKSLGKSPFIDRVNMLSHETMEPDSLGTILSDFLDGLVQSIGDSGFGAFKCIQMEIEGALVLIYALEDDFLFIKARPECKIGRLRYQIEQVL